MQYVNDDMDEQFRKAAEHYPLDTRGADWSKIAAALADPATAVVAAQPKSNRGKMLWLLLLLPLGLICTRYFSNQEPGIAGSTETTAEQKLKNNPDKQLPTTPVLPERNAANSVNPVATTTAAASGNQDNTTTPTTGIKTGGETIQTIKSASPATRFTPGKQGQGKSNSQRSVTMVKGDISSASANASTMGELFSSQVFYTDRLPVNQQFSALMLQPVRAGRTDPGFTTTASVPSILIPKKKRFYAGLMTGADFTTIKFQKIEDAGYDYGLVLGYVLNKQWSVEAGLFRDKKFYYSDGKNFDSKYIYMPPNSKITEVSGACMMLELPVSMRYDFKSRKRSNWYGTAGLSSYIMKKEDYTYTYYYGNTGTTAQHDKTYSNSSTNLFSAVSLSAGYTRPLGKIADLRLEPYLKIPLSGMGWNRLPLLSAGIHIGLTKKLF
jgi:hypothetical protein